MFDMLLYAFVLFGIPAVAFFGAYLAAGITSFALLKSIDLVFGTRLWKGRWW